MIGCSAQLTDAPRFSEGVETRRVTGEVAITPARTDELARLLARVAEERGLRGRALPELVALPAAELTRQALVQIRRDTPEPVRAAHELLLLRLELVPADFDWLLAIERALGGRLHAFYDPELKTIFIDRALVGGARQRALVHELVHALQDQHHALGARLAYAPDAWDRHSALQALAEGDAEAVVARLTVPQAAAATSGPAAASQSGATLSDADTPSVLVRSLWAVYEDGLAFVEPVLARAGWSAVDALFADPPRTTHELLHAVPPSARQPVPILAHAAAPDADWRLSYSDVLGEQTWRIVLEEWLPESAAKRAASGWAGDRLSSFERAGGTALVWELRSDIGTHAALAEAVRDQFRSPQRASAPANAAREDFECRSHRDHGVVAMLSDGPRLWLMSLSDERTDATCPRLANWTARLKLASSAKTRVRGASSVGTDPR
jgi:hypothetical protein